jgi:hypothetical protein
MANLDDEITVKPLFPVLEGMKVRVLEFPKRDPNQCEARNGEHWSMRVIDCCLTKDHFGKHRFEW